MKDNSVGFQGYSLDMSLGHNPAEVGGLLGLVPVPLLQYLLALVDEGALHGTGAEDVVRRDARLAQVEHLPPKDATNGNVQVCRAVHVAGAGGRQGGDDVCLCARKVYLGACKEARETLVLRVSLLRVLLIMKFHLGLIDGKCS